VLMRTVYENPGFPWDCRWSVVSLCGHKATYVQLRFPYCNCDDSEHAICGQWDSRLGGSWSGMTILQVGASTSGLGMPEQKGYDRYDLPKQCLGLGFARSQGG